MVVISYTADAAVIDTGVIDRYNLTSQGEVGSGEGDRVGLLDVGSVRLPNYDVVEARS